MVVSKGYGVVLVMMISFMAWMMSEMSFFQRFSISPLIIGLVLGMLYANTIRSHISTLFDSGIAFSAKRILRVGIIFYGFRLTMNDVVSIGFSGAMSAFVIVCSIFCIGYWLGKKVFKLDDEVAILTAAGSAICGAAAVMATESVLKSSAYKSAIAVSTVVLFGTLAMFLYPLLYRYVHLTPSQMGIYVGASLHEVAHVVGAGNALGESIAKVAVIVKMMRVMLLAPFLITLSWWMNRRVNDPFVERSITIPWFAVMFLVVIAFNSFGWIPDAGLIFINQCDTFFLTMAMCALGMESSFAKFKTEGVAPFYLAGTLFCMLMVLGWVLVRVTTI